MEQDIILKTDRACRVRRPRERQEQIVAEWKNNGMGAMRFARTIGVKCQKLSSWIRRHGGRGEAAIQDPVPRWLEMALAPEPVRPNSGLRVELPGGAAFVVGDADQILLVIQLLRALS